MTLQWPDVLPTERMQLRRAGLMDADFVTDLIQNEVVRRYLGGPVVAARLAASVAGQIVPPPPAACWVADIRATDRPVGLLSLGPHKDGTDHELSYQFHPAAWGRGLATEAGRAVLAAARVAGLPRVIAETQAANTRSRTLLERLGLREVRRLERFGAQQVIYATG